MAQGLQVFDANGKVVVNMQSRTSKMLGKVTTTGSSGSLTDARLLDGTMWYAITKLDGGDYSALEVKANGSKLSWTQKYPTVDGQNYETPQNRFTFVYGIY